MDGSLRPWAAAVVFLLGETVASGDLGAGEALQVQIICFNFETVRVTWNATDHGGTNLTFVYKFSRDEDYGPCTNYILRRGQAAGCLLEATRGVLDFSLRNGTRPLFSRSHLVSDYLKPSSPKDVGFLWGREAVTVTCSDLPYGGLLYEVQHQSAFDSTWQSKEEKTCNVSVEGLDAEKCYSFRARVKTRESHYGPDAYPSDWSEVTHWHKGEQRDSCQERPKPAQIKSPKPVLIAALVTVLTVGLLLLSAWRLERVKKALVPCVPDPKASFPGLFEDHQGNFQAWIADTQNVAPLKKPEGREECSVEEALVVQLSRTDADPPPRTGRRVGEAPTCHGCPQPPPPGPPGGNVVSLGAFTFAMHGDAYVVL